MQNDVNVFLDGTLTLRYNHNRKGAPEARKKGGCEMLREYKIRYKAGTSPYWYIKSLCAESAAEALELFKIRSDLCPDNVKEIQVEE